MADKKTERRNAILRLFGERSAGEEPKMTRTLTRQYIGKKIQVKPSEDTPRGRAFADEETRLRQRQIDVQGEIQRENDDYARRRAELLRRFGAKEE